MSQQIIEDLNRRYSTKSYDANKRIAAEDLAIITEALRLSASSINSQPWKFIVIASDQAKQRFHDSFANKFQFNQKHAKAASHTILFAFNPRYTKDKYKNIVDNDVATGRLPKELHEQMLNGGFSFAEMNTDDSGYNGHWTKAQTYIALGNALHVAARLNIDSTPMEGVDTEMLSELFSEELDGYICETALALGYCDQSEDYNYGLPKSRLPAEQVIKII